MTGVSMGFLRYLAENTFVILLFMKTILPHMYGTFKNKAIIHNTSFDTFSLEKKGFERLSTPDQMLNHELAITTWHSEIHFICIIISSAHYQCNMKLRKEHNDHGS